MMPSSTQPFGPGRHPGGASPLRAETEAMLERMQHGDEAAKKRFFGLVHGELQKIARHVARGSRFETLATTDLVSEAYLRLMRSRRWNDCQHFYAVAARAMRQILCDHARRKKRRPAENAPALDDFEGLFFEGIAEPLPWEILDLDEGLSRLAKVHERAARVLELRYFTGLGCEEIARLMAVNERTVRRDVAFGLAWLRQELSNTA